MCKLKTAGFTLMEMVISLFVMIACFFVLRLGVTLIQDGQKTIQGVDDAVLVAQAFLQLDHYIQKSEFVSIESNNNLPSLVLYHQNKDQTMGTRQVKLQRVDGVAEDYRLVLQNFLGQGYMPLFEHLSGATMVRNAPYIDLQVRYRNHWYAHRFYCPQEKVKLNET